MLPNLGPMEMVMVMGAAVLLFGRRLPEVGRSLGKGIVEFKKGLRGIEDEFDISATSSPQAPARRADDYARSADSSPVSVPKFEPPATAPIARGEYEAATPQD